MTVWTRWNEYKWKRLNGTEKRASSITVCSRQDSNGDRFCPCRRKQETPSMKWQTGGQRHNKEQLEREMRKNREDVLFLIRGLLAESQALQREKEEEGGREGGSSAWQDLLFTPFFPLRSFLYCSLSLVIRPGSTSQASEMGPGSSFSTQGRGEQNQRLLRSCSGSRPEWPGGQGGGSLSDSPGGFSSLQESCGL